MFFFAIEIVDLPMNHGEFPVRYVSLPEGIYRWNNLTHLRDL